MSVITAVREYILQCPCLDELAPMFVDRTMHDPSNYGLSSSGETVLARFFDGSEQRRHNFNLYVRVYSDDDLERVSNTEFLEHFTNWLWDKGRRGELPDLGADAAAESLTPSGGALFDVDEDGDRSVYMIQVTLIYQKGGLS